MIEHRMLHRGLVPLVGVSLLTGCVRRTIEITSTPTEALVWVNSREMGRTPLSFEFTYEGAYDIRLQRDGYQPLATSASTDPPIWDLPGPDFVAEILPLEFDRTVRWHFELERDEFDQDAIQDRARSMQARLERWRQSPETASRGTGGPPATEPIEDQGLMGPPAPFGRPALPPETAPGEAPVRPPELYPGGDGIQPGS